MKLIRLSMYFRVWVCLSNNFFIPDLWTHPVAEGSQAEIRICGFVLKSSVFRSLNLQAELSVSLLQSRCRVFCDFFCVCLNMDMEKLKLHLSWE